MDNNPAAQLLKSASAALAGDGLLKARTGVLLGVSDAAQATLDAMNVRTVFDLAASRVFDTARRLVALETDPTQAEARLNTVAADAVTLPAGVPVNELSRQPLAILRGVPVGLAAALDVATVRDLAQWPPSLAARTLLQGAIQLPGGETPSQLIDDGVPADLRPGNGALPTERVGFTRLVIDQASAIGTLPLEQQADAVDLTSVLGTALAFDRIATGALLSFSQSWFAQGLSLGQLLHSMALAPGESTRMAMVDWSRQSRASGSESLSQSDALSNSTTHNRALSEVTEATAREFQTGSSQTSADSTTTQDGRSAGLEIGPLALGGSSSGATTHTDAMSVSSSFGSRDLAAQFAQNINDRSQQNASSARSRRASVVREVSQSEHETLSTRVITNYNHMHALTVQYYEVVQLFRATTQLDRVERCLFVPLKPLDFGDPALVDRLRATLAEVALTDAARRQLTLEFGVVEVVPQTPRVNVIDVIGTIGSRGNLGNPGLNGATPAAPALGGGGVAAPLVPTIPSVPNIPSVPLGPLTPALPIGTVNPVLPLVGATTAAAAAAVTATATASAVPSTRFEFAPASSGLALAALKGFDVSQLTRLGTLAGRAPLRALSDSAFVPDDALLVGVALRGGLAANIVLRNRAGAELPAQSKSTSQHIPAAPVRFADLASIGLQLRPEDAALNITLRLSIDVQGSAVPLDVPVRLRAVTPAVVQDAIRFNPARAAPELVRHLNANRLHYSQAAFARLDAATIAGLLGRFTWRGLPLGQLVEPQPIAVVANSLVFRVNVPLTGDAENPAVAAEQAAFKAFLTQRGLDRPAPKSEVIPLPTGGVFAEAVLGRFNAAEKIDMTRFWNWQDSPIPVTAPDIAALSSGSRSRAQDFSVGTFATPLVQQQAPTSLPAAAGVAPLLAAVQQSMFRDMSGLAQTAALAQAATEAGGAGATSAGAQAAANLKTVMEQHTERLRIAADVLTGGAGGGGSGGSAPKPPGRDTATERGGTQNSAEDADKRRDSTNGGRRTPGTFAETAATPPTLTEEALAKISGTGAAAAAQDVAEAAAAGPDVESTPPRAAPARRPGTPAKAPAKTPVPTAKSSGIAAFVANAFGPQRPFAQVRVDLLPTAGIELNGPTLVRLTDKSGKSFEFNGSGQSRLSGGFSIGDAPERLLISIDRGAFDSIDGVRQVVPVSAGGVDSPLLALNFEARAVLRVVRLTVKSIFAATSFAPDMADFNQQVAARALNTTRFAKPPEFIDINPLNTTAVVTLYTGDLVIRQIIP
jgi:hypothetical protein